MLLDGFFIDLLGLQRTGLDLSGDRAGGIGQLP